MTYILTPDGFESWLFDEPIYKPNIDQSAKHFIVSLSGGKDSTALLLKLLEQDVYIHEVVHVDTGAEMPEMYDHIEKIENLLFEHGIKFVRIKPEKSFEYYLAEHIKIRGKNKGKQGYGWPDFQNRWCTRHLKLDPLKKYYREVVKKDYESVEFIGFAADEIERADNNQDGRIKEYPLIDFDVTEDEALQYCYSKGYDWGGLYEYFGRVSCYLCPLSTIGKIKYIYENYPILWDRMKVLDQKSYRDFRSDYTLQELENRFEDQERQVEIFN